MSRTNRTTESVQNAISRRNVELNLSLTCENPLDAANGNRPALVSVKPARVTRAILRRGTLRVQEPDTEQFVRSEEPKEFISRRRSPSARSFGPRRESGGWDAHSGPYQCSDRGRHDFLSGRREERRGRRRPLEARSLERLAARKVTSAEAAAGSRFSSAENVRAC